MTKSDALRHDIEILSVRFEQVLVEQVGADFVKLLRQIRQLAVERRAGLPGAAEKLTARLGELNDDQLAAFVRASIIHFDLVNLAEDLHRIRVLRQRDHESGEQPRTESIGDAIRSLKRGGLSAESIQQKLDLLRIEPVFTAHPTEAKRRTTRRVLRHLRQTLQAEHQADALRSEQTARLDSILGDLTLLWKVDPIRPQRPTVLNEVERGLFFFEGLWGIIPELREQMRRALADHFPDHAFSLPSFIVFGSWIGGDRDGNPFVTHSVTEQTLQLLRQAAIQRHLGVCRQLSQLLVMSDRGISIEPEFRSAMEAALEKSPQVRQAVSEISEVEFYRRWLKVIETRLEATVSGTSDDSADLPGYRDKRELETDVRFLAENLGRNNGQRIVSGWIGRWLDQIETFGLQFASLDVRQDSRVHADVLSEVFRLTGLEEDYQAAGEDRRQALLLADPAFSEDGIAAGLSDQARETLSLFQCLARVYREQGSERLGGHVVSMTHEPSDILAVLWFWKWAWKGLAEKNFAEVPYLPIVPLFETILDLQRGPEILDQLLKIPDYARYIRSGTGQQPTQIVMVGYSDSTKDGGYLAACWGLYRVQERLASVARNHGVRLIVFHGRGGSLGRGGGPAARAILSLPPQSVDGALRMTEQGEVIAERYDDPQIAARHLEQVTWATLLMSGQTATSTPAAWFSEMDQLSERSFQKYRELVGLPGFLAYFDQATPISQIERLPIGSRPSRRRERRSLSDLRAIPWTFAWTQCRHFLPAWFGLGSALVEGVHQAGDDWSQLQTMYDEWPFFQATIDNAELALAKSDLGIARRYAELASDSQANAVWQVIEEEFYRTQAAILMITRQTALLAGTPWLQQSIQQRNPYVDPINLMQIELLRRMRQADASSQQDELARYEELVRLTIQGIAAGLRTTG